MRGNQVSRFGGGRPANTSQGVGRAQDDRCHYDLSRRTRLSQQRYDCRDLGRNSLSLSARGRDAVVLGLLVDLPQMGADAGVQLARLLERGPRLLELRQQGSGRFLGLLNRQWRWPNGSCLRFALLNNGLRNRNRFRPTDDYRRHGRWRRAWRWRRGGARRRSFAQQATELLLPGAGGRRWSAGLRRRRRRNARLVFGVRTALTSGSLFPEPLIKPGRGAKRHENQIIIDRAQHRRERQGQ